jgi:outer membrane protein OmpA-like peptidoglycan-associated protein
MQGNNKKTKSGTVICFLQVILLVLSALEVSSQNLLMNGSFEDENICSEYDKNCAPGAWISTSLTADYYFGDPPNSFDGDHFVGLTFSPGNVIRTTGYKFVRSRILCALRKGSVYQLEFYIRSRHARLDSIGIYFSEDDILFRKTSLIRELPQLWVKEGLESQFSNWWQKVSLQYIASGNENFISIGDFRKTSHQFSGGPDLGKAYYYFIDKISLVPLNPLEHICDDTSMIREESYGMDARHKMLDRMVYIYRKNTPPLLTPSSKTVLQRIDTLVIPDVLFAVNSFALNPGANLVLDSFIKVTSSLRVDSLIVEGHTDSTGSVSLNQKLSQNRAATVAAYLQPHFRTLIVSRGWASERPVADNRNAGGRQKNRRVEIYLFVRD